MGREGGSDEGGKEGYSSERRRTANVADLDEMPVLLALSSAAGTGEGRDKRGEEKNWERVGLWEVNTGDYDQIKLDK